MRIFVHNRAATFLAQSHWSDVFLFVVDKSVGATMVSDLSSATSLPVLSAQ